MANTPAPSFAACDRAWNLPEVRDNILLSLPLWDLFLARRVCKDWANNSSPVQEALFLKPRTSHHVEVASSNGSADILADSNAHEDPWVVINNRDTTKTRPGNPLVNPFLPFEIEDVDNGIEYFFAIPLQLLFAGPNIAASNPNGTPDPAYIHPTASWRTMQFIQPPARKIKLFCFGGYIIINDEDAPEVNTKERYEGIEVVSPEGVTVGDVVQAMDEHFGGCEVCQGDDGKFGMQWGWPFHGSAELTLKGLIATGHEVLGDMREC